ncbi:pirin family protein [Plantactinospora sp. KBS50]|uniref:pirin family protein n=1 Tax=Plantactinospora sp. KBS50 TaxID=2024580 RepID=UPI000BAAF3E7|nr:pirin family protein [Plantactinospora sp. KBS50]ASW54981.1 pirin [Plantactinospora sp. KBS50]
MSAVQPIPAEIRPPGAVDGTGEPSSVLLPGHDVPLGRYTTVRRLLPHRQRRMIGAWCFVDHFGPDDVAGRPGMQIPPHPHTGLQTVTWLVEGEILHRDSLGSSQLIRPGELNLMSSGRGIAHSEQSPPGHPPVMHGLQLWIALPERARHGDPEFTHHAAMPRLRLGELETTVLVGEVAGTRSPVTVHSPLVGAQLRLPAGGAGRLPLERTYEHGVLVMSGRAEVAGTPLEPGTLLYLPPERTELTLTAPAAARLLLLGGVPFDEPLVMWWNFVGRSHEEIVEARADWAAGRRFGPVTGDPAGPLPAPAMPTTRLKARDRHGRTSG